MRELRRVIFNRVTVFMLVLLTAVGGVLSAELLCAQGYIVRK